MTDKMNDPFTARTLDKRKKEKRKSALDYELESQDSQSALSKKMSLTQSNYYSRNYKIGAGLEEFKKKTLPLIGNKEASTQYKIVGSLSVIFLAALMGTGLMYNVNNNTIAKVVEQGGNFSLDVQKMNLLFSETVLGKANSATEMVDLSERVNRSLNNLLINTGTNDFGLRQDLMAVDKNINVLKNNFELIRSSAQKVKEFNKDVKDMDEKIDRFINVYTRSALNQNEMTNVYSLKISLQSINGNYVNILLADQVSEANLLQLSHNRDVFKDALIALKDGNREKAINPLNTRETIESYNNIVKAWTELSKKVNLLTTNSKELVQSKNLNQSTTELLTGIINKSDKILESYKVKENNKLNLTQMLMIISLLMLILSVVSLFYIYTYEKDNRNEEEKYKTKKTEEDIREITTELLNVEAGNLTKTLKIKDGITGQIADSVNTTIESLRTLVRKIIDTADILEEKTSEVNEISNNMLTITERQTKDIEETGESVIRISEAIRKIAERTKDGSTEANRSVTEAKDGELQVSQSLFVMKEIKSNMSETVTLMKKVSESSKQILNIVEILSDINQDTEILSMNATVQSTRAGEAGKPFKIVADSIKKLAEKAANEGRRANNLINGVLSDIKAAETAVEKTRSEIEHGVTVTQKAFESFQVMKSSTERLAKTVEEISKEAVEHAEKAEGVQREMRDILMTTELNRTSTKQTAKAIEEISHIAKDMGRSVNTFIID